MPEPIFLDCDTGVDDAMALAYLLASPEADLVGVGTVSGNVDSAVAAANTLDLLVLAGRPDVPVAVGAHHPLHGPYSGAVPHIHGVNGVGDVLLPPSGLRPVPGTGAELLIRLAREHAGRLRVIGIGPLTNLALALRLEPELASLVADVTIMGGAALTHGNLSPVAEANIGNDPSAAAEVFAAGWPITLVPLDVTLDHVLEESDRQELLDSPRPMARALGAILDVYFTFYLDSYGRRCCALHDPLAAAVVTGGVRAALAPTVAVQIDATDGPGRGQTICDMRGRRRGYPEQEGARCRVVLEIDQPLAPHLMARLLSL